ncbi:MAG TPA: hypothetical protein VLA43_09460, partial [Longimicrobiales bacterium]|nr:hypothetical protein [Longimicrobiales bacterium]
MNIAQRLVLTAASVLALSAGASPARAQVASGAPELVDRVVALVGDSAILLSQIEEEVQRIRLQTPDAVPQDPAGLQAFRSEVLTTWVNRLLVLQAAARDSLVEVDEARVEEIVAQEIQQRAR